MSCRASFQPEDQYEQLRRPNAAIVPGDSSDAWNGEQQQQQQQHPLQAFFRPSLDVPATYTAYGAPLAGPSELQNGFTLSANANEFIPNDMDKRGAAGGVPQYQPPLYAQQQQQQQQQPQQQHQQHHHHHQQQHRYKQHHQQQQQHHHHHHQGNYNNHHHHQQQQQHQQQNQQQFNNEMQQLSLSVNSRLNFGKQQQQPQQQQQHNGAVGNYYQSSQQHQVQHQYQQQQQPHTQQQHSQMKFQRHAHLNNSFQQIAQQQQPQHHHQQRQYYHHHHQQPQHHHHQQQQHHHQQQQQQQQQPSTSTAAASSSSASSHPDMETIALEYLDTVIHCLNQNPGQFDTIASRFLTIFDGMESNHYVLSIAMEDIFEKSIEQPNFRYMGAKLYNLLHMLNLKPDSLFQELLKCKLDYHQSEVAEYMKSTEKEKKVRETALFLAELYMQLRGDDDARIQLIAENVVYSLKQLLKSESAENVRCICQTLKLAGYDLSADCQQDIKFIITELQGIEARSPGKYAMVPIVIALQQSNWGRKISNALGGEDGDAAKPPEPVRMSDEPVFYGPDGHELTAEETDFLADGDDATGSDDDDALDLDPEMDEEIEQAYKDFCKQGKKAQANNKS